MNRDLSKVLESLKDVEQKSASTEELAVLKEMMTLLVDTSVALVDELTVITTALKEQSKLINQKVDLNRNGITSLNKAINNLYQLHKNLSTKEDLNA